MRCSGIPAALLGIALVAGCGDGNQGPDDTNALSYMGLVVGTSWSYAVDVSGVEQDGLVKVVAIDTQFVDGVDAYKLDTHQNLFLIATRWYQVTGEGMFLLGEQVKEGTGVVDRTFVTPIKVIPYPLEDERGIPVQMWTTESEMEEGGSEEHRYDNDSADTGAVSHEVPAGTFEAFHLVHTRTDKDVNKHTYDEYFVPEMGFIEFDYPPENTWKLIDWQIPAS